LHTSTFNQITTFEVAKGGFLNEHVKLIRKVYRERRNVMLDSLEEHMPPGIKWTHPQGGLFLWVTLPINLDANVIFKDAIKRSVAFVPGVSFFTDGGGHNTMRLNFSNAKPEMINEGIGRLSEVIKNHIMKK
jgi:DNA-binding transcriptional MocR family regulator